MPYLHIGLKAWYSRWIISFKLFQGLKWDYYFGWLCLMPPFIKFSWHISIFVNYLRSSLTFDISMVCTISHYTGLCHDETWLCSVYIWVPVYMGADTGHPTDSLGPDRSAAGWVLNFQVNMYISTFLGYQQFYMFLLASAKISHEISRKVSHYFECQKTTI